MKRPVIFSAVAILLAYAVAHWGLADAQAPVLNESEALSAQIRWAVKQSQESTVALLTSHTVPRGRARIRTGVVVRPQLILTDAANVRGVVGPLKVLDHSGGIHFGKVAGQDYRLRIAAVVLSGEASLRPIKKTRAIEVGRLALALGKAESPRDPPIVSLGLISARYRFSKRALQLSCDVNDGLTGGPVIDIEGRAYGVSIQIPRRVSPDSGISFAIPWEMLEQSLDRIEKGQDVHPATLGILIPEGEFEGLEGIPIAGVRDKGPAAKAGLRKGDLILKINKTSVRSMRALSELTAQLMAGQEIILTVQRRGLDEPFRLRLTTAARSP